MKSLKTELLSAKNPTLLFMNARGDHLLNLPAIRAVGELLQGRLKIVCREGFAQTYFADVDVNTIIEVPTQCVGLQYRFDHLDVSARIGSTDLFMCLNPIHSDSVRSLINLLSPRMTVGFDLTFDLPLNLDFQIHSSELAFRLPKTFSKSIHLTEYAKPPKPTETASKFAKCLRGKLPDGAILVAIHGETKKEKTWPHSLWSELLGMLQQDSSIFLFDLGVESIELGGEVLQRDRIIHCGNLPMPESLEVVSHSDFFIGIDSCFLHMADLCRVPGIGIFGPTDPHEFGFLFSAHSHCLNRNLSALSAKDVYDSFLSLRRRING